MTALPGSSQSGVAPARGGLPEAVRTRKLERCGGPALLPAVLSVTLVLLLGI
jgi:hypothetical protein